MLSAPNRWGGHSKYQGDCGLKENDQSKTFSNLVIAKHIHSKLGALPSNLPFRGLPPYPQAGLQNFHLVCSTRIDLGQIV